mmetsp:Transcript_30990/g.89564  ORF Transcript_30990/g.89564 Transcript_30990/m.89564 type:complete len:293 (-) Transcript_30990:188-1066(-)
MLSRTMALRREQVHRDRHRHRPIRAGAQAASHRHGPPGDRPGHQHRLLHLVRPRQTRAARTWTVVVARRRRCFGPFLVLLVVVESIRQGHRASWLQPRGLYPRRHRGNRQPVPAGALLLRGRRDPRPGNAGAERRRAHVDGPRLPRPRRICSVVRRGLSHGRLRDLAPPIGAKVELSREEAMEDALQLRQQLLDGAEAGPEWVAGISGVGLEAWPPLQDAEPRCALRLRALRGRPKGLQDIEAADRRLATRRDAKHLLLQPTLPLQDLLELRCQPGGGVAARLAHCQLAILR